MAKTGRENVMMCARFYSRRPIKKCADAIDVRSFIRSPLNIEDTHCHLDGGRERAHLFSVVRTTRRASSLSFLYIYIFYYDYLFDA